MSNTAEAARTGEEPQGGAAKLKPGQERGGRPTKLTPKVQRVIVEMIRAGNYYEVACQLAGVSYGTFRRWMLEGEQPDGRPAYRKFREAVIEAECECEARLVLQWQQAVPHDWRAARGFLERRHPDRWGRKDRHELSGPGGGPIDVRALDAAIERELAGLAGGGEASLPGEDPGT